MDIFEKTKLALRNYIQENPDKVKADLENMRKKSSGNDIAHYYETFCDSMDISNVEVTKEEDFQVRWCDDTCLHESMYHRHSIYKDLDLIIDTSVVIQGIAELISCSYTPGRLPPIIDHKVTPKNYYKPSRKELKKEDLVKNKVFFFTILVSWKNQKKRPLV